MTSEHGNQLGGALRSPGARPARGTAFWIAVSGGAGLVPVWPGTAGAVVGVGVALALVPAVPVLMALALAALFAIGVWASAVVAATWNSDDPQFVVVDETFGTAATLAVLPAEPLWWFAGFLAFRFFDVVKPWPAGFVHDRVRGGLGIMLDDALAAVWAVGVLLAVGAALEAWA